MSWYFCHYLYPMQFILPSFYAVLFIFLILKMNFFVIPSITKMNLVWLFILKLAAAAIVGLVYTFYYQGADFITFFNDSSVLIHNFLQNDTRPYASWFGSFENTPLIYSSKIMIVINAVMQLFSFGNMYVHFVFFCFFSFVGMAALLKAFIQHFSGKKWIFILLFFVPGILFWSSAPLKEALVIGLTGLFLYFTDFGLRKKYSVKQIVIIVLVSIFLIVVKIYVFLALLPAIICNIIVARTSDKFWFFKYSAGVVAFSLIAIMIATANPELNVLKLISDKQAKAISEAKGGLFLMSDKKFISVDYKSADTVLVQQGKQTYKIVNGSTYLMWGLDNMKDTTFVANSNDTSVYTLLYKIIPANSTISLKKLKPEFKYFITYAPLAFINTLIHPTLYEISSWFQLISALENLFIILIIIAAVFFFDHKAMKKKEILFLCITFSLIIYVLVGITTPSLGAMVRYKTIAELFLISGCLLMIDLEKLKKVVLRK